MLDGKALHYGRDDFASDAKLAAVLSRDRAKDMADHYAAEPVRAFAEKREIRLPERVREIVRTVETRAKSMFAGFRPKAPEAPPGSPRDGTSRPDQDVAIRRYGKAWPVDTGLFFIPLSAAMLLAGFGALVAGWRTPWRYRWLLCLPSIGKPGSPLYC